MTDRHPDLAKPIISWLRTRHYPTPVFGMPDILLAKFPPQSPGMGNHLTFFIEDMTDLISLYRAMSRKAVQRADGTITLARLETLASKASILRPVGRALYIADADHAGWPALFVDAYARTDAATSGLYVFSTRLLMRQLNGVIAIPRLAICSSQIRAVPAWSS